MQNGDREKLIETCFEEGVFLVDFANPVSFPDYVSRDVLKTKYPEIHALDSETILSPFNVDMSPIIGHKITKEEEEEKGRKADIERFYSTLRRFNDDKDIGHIVNSISERFKSLKKENGNRNKVTYTLVDSYQDLPLALLLGRMNNNGTLFLDKENGQIYEVDIKKNKFYSDLKTKFSSFEQKIFPFRNVTYTQRSLKDRNGPIKSLYERGFRDAHEIFSFVDKSGLIGNIDTGNLNFSTIPLEKEDLLNRYKDNETEERRSMNLFLNNPYKWTQNWNNEMKTNYQFKLPLLPDNASGYIRAVPKSEYRK